MGRVAESDWAMIVDSVKSQGFSIIPLLAEKYSVSKVAINTRLRKLGIRRRGTRGDKGKRSLKKDKYHQLAILCTAYKRTAEDAIKDAIYSGKIDGKIENGQIVKSEIHPNTLRKYLREDDLNKKSLLKKGSFKMVTEKPLDVVQWDSTRATQWFVEKEYDEDTVISFVPEQSENKNRSKKNKAKLSFFVFQDMFSRKVWFKVVAVENTLSFLDFFYEMAAEIGMPNVIYTDNASMFHKTGRVRAVLEKLGTKMQTHAPGNSQAKGMVERTIRTLEEKARITLVEKAKTLKEYNKIVKYIQNEYNNRSHSSTKLSPNSLFYSHLHLSNKKLPPPYEDFRRLAPSFDFRQLKGSLTIEWKGKTFQARENRNTLANYIGKKIRVEENYKRKDLVYLIVEGKEIEAFDINIHGEITKSFGQYNELPESRREKLIKEIDEYKEMTASYSQRFSSSFGDTKDEREPVYFNIEGIKRRGKEHNFLSAKIYLAKNGLIITDGLELILCNLFSEREAINESELDILVREEKQA